MEQVLKPGLRVTLRMGSCLTPDENGGQSSVPSATLTTPLEPMENGFYWGYFTRVAANLHDMMTNCPFKVSRAMSRPLSQEH